VNPIKQVIRSVFNAGITLAIWADGEVEEDEEGEEVVLRMERDAAYLTTGLITAVRGVHQAHDADDDCLPHHNATASLLIGIENPMTAIRVIQHLLDIVASTVDDEDVQQMVANIVATELGEIDPRHHHH
jgi:hypothetical protein